MSGTTDGRLARGEQTRRIILDQAMRIASVEGLEGLSIGRLAADLHLSKSGLFAHFGSKEELQLATFQAARELFVARVVLPAQKEPEGIARVEALVENWLAYVEEGTFPGGCIVYSVSAEFDARTGRVHDAVALAMSDWYAHLGAAIRTAVARGELAEDTDPEQLTFELSAFIWEGVGVSVMHGNDEFLVRARRAAASRLACARSGAPR